MPFQANADHRHHVPKQRHRMTNSAAHGAALRQTEGLIGSIVALLGLGLAVPDHATMSRRAEMLHSMSRRLRLNV